MGRILGPFPKGSLSQVQISSLGVIPKKSNPAKWRLIMDLSSPHGASVNDGIASELCSLSYISVDLVADRVAAMGRGTLLAKMDVQEAYRLVPVHPDDRHLLGLSWRNMWYVDATLPFGLRSAPMIFSSIADAFEWILYQEGVSWVAHYIDDIITMGSAQSSECAKNRHIILSVGGSLGLPFHKCEGPTCCLIFLGIEVDTEAMELRLPQVKLDNLRSLIKLWLDRKACTKHQLESLIGHLNYACKVVRPGRTFLGRLINLLKETKAKRPRDFIRLNQEARSDLQWWGTFLPLWNGISMLRPHKRSEPDHEIWSDASGSWGCGALWDLSWFHFQWPAELQPELISTKELIPIVIAATVWGPSWAGKLIRCNCDNQAVVSVINSGYSKDPALMHLLRCLFFISAHFDFSVVATHIAGHRNTLADALSRDNLPLFFSLAPQADKIPVVIPDHLIQVLAVEKPDWTSSCWIHWFHSTFVVH